MNGSQIADEIDREYRLRMKYRAKRAKKFKNKECMTDKLYDNCDLKEEEQNSIK